MMTQVERYTTNLSAVVPPEVVKDTKHRLMLYAKWLDRTGRGWAVPDMAAYRDFLLYDHGLSPSSAKAHLATVRGRYNAIMRDNDVRDLLYSLTPDHDTPANRKALVDEALERIKNAIDPAAAPVKVTQRQDVPDSAHLRLTTMQANVLLAAPGIDTLMGMRDTAMIAMMLCTGVREAELCALDVEDLRQQLDGELALYIRKGKGLKARLVPYGELIWVLAITEAWMTMAGVEDGPVFRGFFKGGKHVRNTRLTVRAVNQVLERYPVEINGRFTKVNPHDLRRTYARRLYDAGVDLVAIQQNLGHADSKTTLGYIGQLGADARRPPLLYDFDLSRLQPMAR